LAPASDDQVLPDEFHLKVVLAHPRKIDEDEPFAVGFPHVHRGLVWHVASRSLGFGGLFRAVVEIPGIEPLHALLHGMELAGYGIGIGPCRRIIPHLLRFYCHRSPRYRRCRRFDNVKAYPGWVVWLIMVRSMLKNPERTVKATG